MFLWCFTFMYYMLKIIIVDGHRIQFYAHIEKLMQFLAFGNYVWPKISGYFVVINM